MAMSQSTSGCFVQQKNFGINSKLKNRKSRTDLKQKTEIGEEIVPGGLERLKNYQEECHGQYIHEQIIQIKYVDYNHK